jgi:shikimate kinase
MRPPVCLRYAMWALAATFSDKYSQYEDLLYERARRYAEAAEMKVRPHIQLGLRTHAEVHRALAATFSDKYSQYEDLLYERARRYAEAAEMKVRPHIQLGLRTHAEVHRAMARVLSRFNMPKHGY